MIRKLVWGMGVLWVAVAAAQAQNYFSQTSGDWTNAANWSPALPNSGTQARIGAGSPGVSPATATIHAGDAAACSSLYVGQGGSKTGTLNIEGGTLTTATETVMGNNAGDYATINQSGGTFIAPSVLWLGMVAGSTGIYNMTDGILTNTDVRLRNGYGEFNLSGNSKIYGRSGGETYVGYSGSGKVTMTGGYWDNNNQVTYVPYNDGSFGRFDISGGTFTNARWRGGQWGGRGEVNVSGSAVLYLNDMILAGQSTAATQIVTVSGGSMTVAGTCNISTKGEGSLTVSNGTFTAAGGMTITTGGGRGTVSVCGGVLKSSTTYLGWNGGETTRFNIYGGEVYMTNSGSFLSVGHTAGNDCLLTITNGLFVHGSTGGDGFSVGYSGSGTVHVVNGTITNNVALYVGRNGGGDGRIIQEGGSWEQKADARIANSGQGYYCLSNGVMRFDSANVLYVGYGTGMAGVMDMYGGTNWPGAAVVVGRSGAGTLNLYGGQFLMTNSGSYFEMANQGVVGNTGTLNVAGGTLIITNAASEGMIVGRYGAGNLNLSSGSIENYGSLMMARQAGSSGSVLQSGGTWLQRGTTTIGLSVAASFRLTGGSFWADNVTVGNSTASRLDISGTNRLFQVGGTLTVNTGATVTNRVQGVAGGLVITNTAAGAVVVNAGGKIHVKFEQNPQVTAPYWGLSWSGSHSNDLQALATAGKLTWDDSALYPLWQGQAGIYYDGTNTYVGIPSASTLNGTAIRVY